MNKFLKFLTDKKFRFGILVSKNLVPWMSDERVLRKKYKLTFNKKLNLDNPTSFNEKMQWLKLNYRKEIFTDMVDKYASKLLVKEKIGDEYVIPLYGTWDCFDDIDFNQLPDQFVLKASHDCGSVIVVKDKNSFDKEKAKRYFDKKMKKNYYYGSREWPYKNIKPKIIAEKFMKNKNTDNLDVYKFFCFSGNPTIVQTIQNDKHVNESIDYFDMKWNLLDLRQNFPNSEKPLGKPKTLDIMISIARKLSEGFPFIRIDLYEINEKVYFSEFTFYSDAGEEMFHPEKWDEELGALIKLPEPVINK